MVSSNGLMRFSNLELHGVHVVLELVALTETQMVDGFLPAVLKRFVLLTYYNPNFLS